MKPLYVKLCGAANIDSAMLMGEVFPSAIGFVFSPSVRRVTPRDVAAMWHIIWSEPHLYAVFNKIDAALLREAAALDVLTHVQADWAEEHVAREAAPQLTFVPVFRDTPSLADELAQERRTGGGRMILIEGARSGSGQTVDWDRVGESARGMNFLLAGGLNAGNVAEAVRRARPAGVDVSSGIEEQPGLKCGRMIDEFLQAVRAVEQELS